MYVFGTHVPTSGWTLVAVLVGVVVSLLLTPLLTVRAGWSRWPTLVALLGLTAYLALTITPGNDVPPFVDLENCLPDGLGAWRQGLLHTGGGLASDILNTILPVPWTLAAVLATRRVLAPALAAVLLPAVVELAQAGLPGRSCSPTDWLTNSLGGLLGVGLGVLLLRLSRARTSTPP